LSHFKKFPPEHLKMETNQTEKIVTRLRDRIAEEGPDGKIVDAFMESFDELAMLSTRLEVAASAALQFASKKIFELQACLQMAESLVDKDCDCKGCERRRRIIGEFIQIIDAGGWDRQEIVCESCGFTWEQLVPEEDERVLCPSCKCMTHLEDDEGEV
jgi:hypothetical protein